MAAYVVETYGYDSIFSHSLYLSISVSESPLSGPTRLFSRPIVQTRAAWSEGGAAAGGGLREPAAGDAAGGELRVPAADDATGHDNAAS